VVWVLEVLVLAQWMRHEVLVLLAYLVQEGMCMLLVLVLL